MNRRHAYSLLEMLVALVLTSVLILFAFSATNRVSRSVRASKDLSNMRTLWVATELFSSDHHDGGRIFLAHDRYEDRYNYGYKAWFQYLRPYLGYELNDRYSSVDAFIAPGDPSGGGAKSTLQRADQAFLRRSFSFSTGTLDTYNRTYTWRKLQIANPSKLLLFCNHRGGELSTMWVDPASAVSRNGIPTDWYLHGKAHFAFLDGHVESIPVEEVLPGGERASIFVPDLRR